MLLFSTEKNPQNFHFLNSPIFGYCRKRSLCCYSDGWSHRRWVWCASSVGFGNSFSKTHARFGELPLVSKSHVWLKCEIWEPSQISWCLWGSTVSEGILSLREYCLWGKTVSEGNCLWEKTVSEGILSLREYCLWGNTVPEGILSLREYCPWGKTVREYCLWLKSWIFPCGVWIRSGSLMKSSTVPAQLILLVTGVPSGAEGASSVPCVYPSCVQSSKTWKKSLFF